MKFLVSAATVAALFSMIASANYTENPIHAPMGGEVVSTCGQYTIKWTPTTPGRVDIVLKKGPSNNLGDVGPITIAVPNSGVFFWHVPCDLQSGPDYAIEIKAGEEINFTGQFTINNTGKTTPATTSSTSASPTTTTAASTGASTKGKHATTTPCTTNSTTSTEHSHPTAAPFSNSTSEGNSTHSATKSSTSETTASASETGAKHAATHPAESSSMATALKSSFALAAVVMGAVIYIL